MYYYTLLVWLYVFIMSTLIIAGNASLKTLGIGCNPAIGDDGVSLNSKTIAS